MTEFILDRGVGSMFKKHSGDFSEVTASSIVQWSISEITNCVDTCTNGYEEVNMR